MRRCRAAAAVAALSAAALISMGAQATSPTGLRSAVERVNATEPVARTCREVCNAGVCRRRCFNRADYNEAYVEPRSYRDRSRDYGDWWRYRDYDRGPAFRFHFGLD
jgi:hypothetical protein